MKNLDQVLTVLFAYVNSEKQLHFPMDASFNVRLGTATPEEIEAVEDWKTKARALREATILKLTELGVENPKSTLDHFELLHSL